MTVHSITFDKDFSLEDSRYIVMSETEQLQTENSVHDTNYHATHVVTAVIVILFFVKSKNNETLDSF
jgi:hypothetical protein